VSQIAPLSLTRRAAPSPRPAGRLAFGLFFLALDGTLVAFGPQAALPARFLAVALSLPQGGNLGLVLATSRTFLLGAWLAGTSAVAAAFILMALVSLPVAGRVVRAVLEGAAAAAFFFLALFAPWRGDPVPLSLTLGALLTPRLALLFSGGRGIRSVDLLFVLLSAWGMATLAMGTLPWLAHAWGLAFPLKSPGDLLVAGGGRGAAWPGVAVLGVLAAGPFFLASAVREGRRS